MYELIFFRKEFMTPESSALIKTAKNSAELYDYAYLHEGEYDRFEINLRSNLIEED